MYRRLPAAGLLLALAASPALADENSGLYLGAGVGDFSSEFDDIDEVDIDFDEDSDATKFFGGWRFNRFVAVQLDYIDFGDSRATSNLLDIESDATGLAPSVVGTLPLGPLELFAKAGMLFYDVEINSNGESLIDESGDDVVYGAGLGVTILERLALRAEYEVIEISEFDDAEAVWVTAAWRF
jgi:OOP family OmpA-OmpF porin